VKGVEHDANVQDSAGKSQVAAAGAAKASVAVSPPVPADAARGEPVDTSLRAVVDAWPTLPEPIKAGVLAMVKVSRRTGDTLSGAL